MSAAADTLDVFLVAGQSNAVGNPGDATDATIPSVPSGVAYEYHPEDGLVELSSPVGYGYGQAKGGSAWPAFAAAYHERTGRSLAFVSRAHGGARQTAHWNESGDLYEQALTATRDCLAVAAAGDTTPVLRGVLWSQGESDALALVDETIQVADYRHDFAWLRSAFRDDLDRPNLPFFVFETGNPGALVRQRNEGIVAALDRVRDVQRAACATEAITHRVFGAAKRYPEAGNIAGEGWHYTQAGYNQMGRRGAAGVADALETWGAQGRQR
jgi:hypothetical protein